MSKDLSALAAKLFIQTNSVLSPTFYKCGWLVATRQILAEAGKSSNAPPTKLVLVPFKKKWKNRLQKQRRDRLFNHLSYKLRQACYWTEISLLERQKLSFAAKLGNSKILKRLSINPGNWRWNPLANYAGWSYEQMRRWRNFTALKFFMRMHQTKQKFVRTKFVLWFCRDNSSFVR